MMKRTDTIAIVVLGIAVGLLVLPVVATVLPGAGPIYFLVAFLLPAIAAPICLFIASLIARVWAMAYQLAKFVAVGVLNSFVDLGVLNLLIYLTAESMGWFYAAFKTVSFVVAVGNSYFWNKHWTFQAKTTGSTSETVKFYLVSIVGWLVNVGLATLIVNVVPRPEAVSVNAWANIGAFVAIAGSMVANFVGYKFFVFVSAETRRSAQT